MTAGSWLPHQVRRVGWTGREGLRSTAGAVLRSPAHLLRLARPNLVSGGGATRGRGAAGRSVLPQTSGDPPREAAVRRSARGLGRGCGQRAGRAGNVLGGGPAQRSAGRAKGRAGPGSVLAGEPRAWREHR